MRNRGIMIVDKGRVIKNKDEIPEVLKEENVNQPLIYLSNTINGIKRDVVLLGEMHLANKREEQAARRILPYFKYIGCEGIDVRGFIEGKCFFWIVDHIITPIFTILLLLERRSKKNKSFISTAYSYENEEDSKLKKIKIINLEKGWKPSTRMRIFFIAFPIIFAKSIYDIVVNDIVVTNKYGGGWGLINIIAIIIFITFFDKIPIVKNILHILEIILYNYIFDICASRERNMIKNLMVEFNKNEKIKEILVLTGASHTNPLKKLLIKEYGFGIS